MIYEIAPLVYREMRARARKKVMQIAAALGKSRQTVNRIENGTQRPSVEEERMLVEATNLSRKAPGIQALARTPLLLAIMCLIHRLDGVLPSDRGFLYERCCDVIIVKRDRFRGIRATALAPHIVRRRIEMIAFWLHSLSEKESEVHIVTALELENKIVDFLMEKEFSELDKARDEGALFLSYVQKRTYVRGLSRENSDDRLRALSGPPVKL